MNFQKAASLIYAELYSWFLQATRLIPKLAVAILLLLFFAMLSRWVSRWSVRGLTRVSNNLSLVNLTGAVVRVLIVAAGLFIALGVLGLDKTVTSLLAGAGVIALAVGFAFQDLTANFISGTMIALARPIQVGDTVETNGFLGKVLTIKLRSVVLDNGQGQTVELPSKDVFQKPIINYSRLGQRRVELVAGVSYLDDLDKAQQIALLAVGTLPFVLSTPKPEFNYRSFGDSVQFSLLFWIHPTATPYSIALSEAMKALKLAFDKHHILMLFAGHTFDLKQKLGWNPEPPSA
ncbi:mechanosensitive ion channel family protein [Fibrella sp. WM1]|uniref:mechanosensitive ion channel family protein n=1 Tax=Fibrella musci TaxID=3242485 RepID=UPI003521F1B2